MDSNSSNVKKSTVGIVLNAGYSSFQCGDIFVTHNSHQMQNKPNKEKVNLDNQFPVPLITEVFLGRDQEIKDLIYLFFNEKCKQVVMHGPAGSGKTELSIKFVEVCKKKGLIENVLWIQTDILNSFECIRDIYEQCKGQKYLIIFDNSPVIRSVVNYNTKEDFFILINSKESKWPNKMKYYQLNSLTSQAATNVLEHIMETNFKETDRGLYKNLVNAFINIPLGLNIAGSHIRQILEFNNASIFNIKHYIEQITKDSENSTNNCEQYFKKAIEISLETIKSDNQLESFILCILYGCMYLNRYSIALSDLVEILNSAKLLTKCKYDIENKLKSVLISLANFSIISYEANTNEIRIKNLTHKMLRQYLQEDSDVKSMCYQACLKLLLKYTNVNKNKNVYILDYFFTLKYSDKNVETFNNFYVDNKDFFLGESIQSIEIFEEILNLLLKWKCTKTVKKIIEDFDDRTREYSKKYNLLPKVVYHNNTEILEILLQRNIDINTEDKFRNSPLHTAAFRGRVESISRLIQHDPNLNNKVNKKGNTPLFDFFQGLYKHIVPSDLNDNNIPTILELLKCETSKQIRNGNNESVLHLAAGLCHFDLLYLVLDKYKMNTLINEQDCKGRTPLHTIICRYVEGFIAEIEAFTGIRMLLRYNCSLDIRDYITNATPLEMIIDNKSTYLVRVFLDFDYKYRDDINKHHLLHKVIFLNDIAMLTLLLEHSVDVNNMNGDGNTPMHVAASEYNLEAIQILLTYNPDLMIKNCEDNTALFNFLFSLKDRETINYNEIIKILEHFKFRDFVTTTNKCNKTLLHFGAAVCFHEFIQLLINPCKMDVNAQDDLKNTPLHTVINCIENFKNMSELRIRETVKILVSNGASLDKKNKSDKTCLELILDKRYYFLLETVFTDSNLNAVELLLKDSDCATACIAEHHLLSFAAQRNQVSILKLLLTYDIDINHSGGCRITEFQNVTALHAAAWNANIESAIILKEHGANMYAKTKNGATPLYLYFCNIRRHIPGYIELNKIKSFLNLFDFKNNCHIKNKGKHTLLHSAIFLKHAALVDYLLTEYELEVDVKCDFGHTPLHILILRVQPNDVAENIIETIEVLKKHGARLDILNEARMTPLQMAQQRNLEYLLPHLSTPAPVIDRKKLR